MNDTDVLVCAEHISKKFCRNLQRSLWYGLRDLGAQLSGRDAPDRLRLRRDEFFGLDDVSFRLRRGESLALIGRNGAGKSTLLKLVNGLIRPDAGTLRVRGRVGALIELGSGFSPLLTGRENIAVNAAVLGMSQAELAGKMDSIIDFAGIDEYIDSPLRTYSSGMRVRLGFAVASHLAVDLMLIDEVLAVGDMAFRHKCFRRISELLEQGTAVILVTHNPHSVFSVCESALYLRSGKAVATGDAYEVMQKYEQDLLPRNKEGTLGQLDLPPNRSVTGLSIRRLCFADPNGVVLPRVQTGRSATLYVRCESTETIHEAELAVTIRAGQSCGDRLLGLCSAHDGIPLMIPKGTSDLKLCLPTVTLPPGIYSAKVLVSKRPVFRLDAVESFIFEVGSTAPMGRSQFYQPRRWSIEPVQVCRSFKSTAADQGRSGKLFHDHEQESLACS